MPVYSISGYPFSIPDRYIEGMRMSEAEAHVLNSARRASLRRIIWKALEPELAQLGPGEMLSPETLAEVQQKAIRFATEYRFAPLPRMPVQAEAHRVAIESLEASLRQHGESRESIGEVEFAKRLGELITLPAIIAEAHRRTQANRRAAAESLEDLL